MRAVNLVPGDARRGTRSTSGGPFAPAYGVIAVLAVAVAFVTLYVLTNNTISERQSKLTTLQAELTQTQAQAAGLANYASFEKLAQARAETVRQIAATRFDWYSALSDLSRVVPANTSLSSLFGSVAPGATIANGASGGSGAASSLRGDMSVPAFELSGCTKSQDDVARLMSRLRLINGVTRVTLGDSQKPLNSAATGSTATTVTGTQGCGADAPTFDLVVFFSSLPGAGPTGAMSGSAQSVGTTPPASTPAGAATAASTATTTPTATPVSTSGSAK